MFFYKPITHQLHSQSQKLAQIPQKNASHSHMIQRSYSQQNKLNLSKQHKNQQKLRQKILLIETNKNHIEIQANFLFTQNNKLFQKRRNFNNIFNFLKQTINCNFQPKKNLTQYLTSNQKKLNNWNKIESPYTKKTLNKYSKSLHQKKYNQKVKTQKSTIFFTKIPSKIMHSSLLKNKRQIISEKQHDNGINRKKNKRLQNYKQICNPLLDRIDQSQASKILKGDQQSNSINPSQFISKQSACNRSKNNQYSLFKSQSESQNQKPQNIKFVRFGARTQSCKPVKTNQFAQKQNQNKYCQQSLLQDQNLSNSSNLINKRKKHIDQKNKKTFVSKKHINICRDVSYDNKMKSKINGSDISQSSIDTLQLFTQYNIKYPQTYNNKKQKYDDLICQKIEPLPSLIDKNLKNITNLKNLKKESNFNNKNNKKNQNNTRLISWEKSKPFSQLKKGNYKKPQQSTNECQKSKIKLKTNERQFQIVQKDKQIIKQIQLKQNQKQKQKQNCNTKRLKLKRMSSYQAEMGSLKKSTFQIVKKPTQRNSIIKVHKSSLTIKKIESQQRQSKRVIFLDQKKQLKESEKTDFNFQQKSSIKNKNVSISSRGETRRKGTFYSNYSIKDMISEDYSEYNNSSQQENNNS